MNICCKCGKSFEPIKGFVQYCSSKCRNSRTWSEKDKIKKSNSAKNSENVLNFNKGKKVIISYICSKCNEHFENKRIHSGRNIHCKKCRRKTPRIKEGVSLLDFSLRTVAKILKKANIPCQNCGYNKASRDVHHILPRKEGGDNDNNNLVILCPTCHREAHEGYIEREFLKTKSIGKTFPNYKEFYHKV